MTVLHTPIAPTGIVDEALTSGNLTCAYQPIVDLETNDVVGVEALARWPHSPGLNPGSVFAAAADAGRTAELDWACRIDAMRGALAADLPASAALFINVEPATLGSPAPAGYEHLVEAAQGRLRIVLELTERALLRNPAEVLRLVSWARERGWGIAMDDVGAEPESLHFLPFVAPDVVKLDLSLAQRRHGPVDSRTVMAVSAQAEETGAVVLAEGIETTAHLEQALAMGAQYGQGWRFGRPGPLSSVTFHRGSGLPPSAYSFETVGTPFDLVANSPRLRRSKKSLLLALTRQLESRAAMSGQPGVLLSAFQDAHNFTPGTAVRYRELAADLPFVGAFGAGMGGEPAPGVRGADLASEDPLIGEWTVVVIGPHYAGALIARDCGDDVPDMDRRFDFLLTHRRELVLQAGRSLMRRIIGLH